MDWNRLKLAYYRHREKIWALHPKLSGRIEDYYQQLIINEGKAANISNASRVLLIGAGATPYTVVALTREFGCSATAIDKDPIAAMMARLYLKSKAGGLDVKVKSGNGKVFDVESFDVVAIALHARPKGEILEHLANSPNKNLRVILRNPRGRYTDMYEEMTDNLVGIGFKIKCELKHPEPYRFNTLVLERLEPKSQFQ